MTRRAICLFVLLPVLGCTSGEAPVSPAAPASTADAASGSAAGSAADSTAAPESTGAPDSAAAAAGQPASESPGRVVVVGDATAADVVKELRQGEISVSEDKSQVGSADLIVVAHDATQGPTRPHNEIAPEIAKNRQAKVLWILTNTAKIEDAQLLEVSDLEIRELVSSHNYPGDTIQMAVDTETTSVSAKTPMLKGWNAIRQYVSGKPAGE